MMLKKTCTDDKLTKFRFLTFDVDVCGRLFPVGPNIRNYLGGSKY